MNIQDRVLSTLKPLIASKGFGDKTVQGLATNLVGGLTEESTDEEITTLINGAMPMIDLMQSENTRYANEIKKKTQVPTPAPAEQPNPENPPAPQAASEIAELTEKVNKLLQLNETLSLKEKWTKLAEANGITNPTLVNKWRPESEEDFDSAMEELKDFNKDFVKQQANTRSPGKPEAGEGGNTNPKKPKELTGAGKTALEGFKKANERHAKQTS